MKGSTNEDCLDAIFNCYEKLIQKSMGNYITNFNKYVIKKHWKVEPFQFYRRWRKIMITLRYFDKEEITWYILEISKLETVLIINFSYKSSFRSQFWSKSIYKTTQKRSASPSTAVWFIPLLHLILPLLHLYLSKAISLMADTAVFAHC